MRPLAGRLLRRRVPRIRAPFRPDRRADAMEERVAAARAGWSAQARMLVGVVVSMRPRQWIKNCVVFAALIFAKKLGDRVLLLHACVAFVLFCLVSGAVYIVNDLCDADRDRRHPVKSRRPIASRALGTVAALTSATLLLTVALMGGFILSPPFGAVLLI